MNKIIEIYDAQSVKDLEWSSTEMEAGEIEYLLTLTKEQPEKFIKNAIATFLLLRIDKQVIPITICEYAKKNTYIVSLYSQYINYSIEELSAIKNIIFRKLAHWILLVLGSILNQGYIDKCVHVNNWLFPTNIHSPLLENQIKRVTKYLVKKYPYHSILFRTLNDITDHELILHLQSNNYHLIGSRQVHILRKEKLKSFHQRKPRDLGKDEKILAESDYKVIECETNVENTRRMKELYHSLYIQKHSCLNPQYTQEFFNFLTTNKMFNIKLIQNPENIDAFIGYLVRQNITYAPLFGYDTTLPAKRGLYRILSMVKINAAIENNTLLHSSAGAGGFKRYRGHESLLEYHAVYIRHLPIIRQTIWRLLKWMVKNIGMPIIQRYDT